jgi:hypothetical protein
MHQALRTILAQIDQVLEAERVALKTLDLPGIELAAERKQQLEEQLRTCTAGVELGAEDRDAVLKVRTTALGNQLLLVHARACVRGALALATGQPAEPYAQHSNSTPGPVRVNLRG